jgi:hypothetical protein
MCSKIYEQERMITWKGSHIEGKIRDNKNSARPRASRW